jgi:hypothetical protein
METDGMADPVLAVLVPMETDGMADPVLAVLGPDGD